MQKVSLAYEFVNKITSKANETSNFFPGISSNKRTNHLHLWPYQEKPEAPKLFYSTSCLSLNRKYTSHYEDEKTTLNVND